MAKNEGSQPTCPVCRSPLLPEAVKKGKCQCCGAKLEPEKTAEKADEKA